MNMFSHCLLCIQRKHSTLMSGRRTRNLRANSCLVSPAPKSMMEEAFSSLDKSSNTWQQLFISEPHKNEIIDNHSTGRISNNCCSLVSLANPLIAKDAGT